MIYSLNSRLKRLRLKTAEGDSKGGKPLAYWGIFSGSETIA